MKDQKQIDADELDALRNKIKALNEELSTKSDAFIDKYSPWRKGDKLKVHPYMFSTNYTPVYCIVDSVAFLPGSLENEVLIFANPYTKDWGRPQSQRSKIIIRDAKQIIEHIPQGREIK